MIAALNRESIDILLGISFGTLMISALVLMALMARLHRILRVSHPETYERLGRTPLFLKGSARREVATTLFLLGGHFRQFNDPKLLRLGAVTQVFCYAFLVLFVSLEALIFIFAPTFF